MHNVYSVFESVDQIMEPPATAQDTSTRRQQDVTASQMVNQMAVQPTNIVRQPHELDPSVARYLTNGRVVVSLDEIETVLVRTSQHLQRLEQTTEQLQRSQNSQIFVNAHTDQALRVLQEKDRKRANQIIEVKRRVTETEFRCSENEESIENAHERISHAESALDDLSGRIERLAQRESSEWGGRLPKKRHRHR
jgi:ubiquinone biosynthesis protein UbiJ